MVYRLLVSPYLRGTVTWESINNSMSLNDVDLLNLLLDSLEAAG